MSYLEQRITIQNRADALQKEILRSPHNPTLYNELGILLEKTGALDKAIHYYKEAIARDVKFVKAYNNIGVILYKQGRYNAAIEIFKLSLKADSQYSATYVNLGAACNKAKRYEEGEKALLHAIMIDEENSGAYANLGNIYNKMKRYDEAIIQHEMALMLDDRSASNYANIGISYKNLRRYTQAKEALQKAIMIDPYFVNAHFDLATTYFTLGEYEKGFEAYEWRFKKPEMQGLLKDLEKVLQKPLLTLEGDSMHKKVFLYTEQGYGDTLQFVRFVKLLKEKFPALHITLQVRAGLKSLLEGLSYIDRVIDRDEAIGDFDCQCALMSLPYLLGTSIDTLPTKTPYIEVFDGDIDLSLEGDRLNIGIVWGASSTGESYEDKVFSLAHFKPWTKDKDIKLYSLQVAGDVKEIQELGYEDDVVDLEEKLYDFKQTALAIEKLDLVITSDTSVAHLAGALGKEAWVILQKNADWRWGLEGETSLWYPSLKLIRQEKQGDWESAFKKLAIMIEERKTA